MKINDKRFEIIVRQMMHKVPIDEPGDARFLEQQVVDKLEIKKEIEALYNVTVVDVNTVKYAGKNKSRYTKAGIINGRTNAFKKAIVTLKEGDRCV